MTFIGPRREHFAKPPNARRRQAMRKFGLKYVHPATMLTESLIDQLDRAQSDEARRLILGRSERMP